MRDVGEALAELCSPYVHESFSVLTGERLLAIDCTAREGVADERALERARTALDELACPSVAFCTPEPGKAAAELAARCDVRVSSDEQFAQVATAVEEHPLASLALVQLLRQSERLDIHQGLIAESLVYSVLQSGPEFAAWRYGDQFGRRRKRAMLYTAGGLAAFADALKRHNAASTPRKPVPEQVARAAG